MQYSESDSAPRQISVETILHHRKEVRQHISATFGNETKALHWLNRPNQIFGGKTPSEMLATEPGAVETELVRIDHGIFA